MNSKLYIGNLSYSTTENTLLNLFFQSGTVISVDLIKDRSSNRPKGFAFIVMANISDAEQAIEMFDGHRLDDSQIRVSFAQRRDDVGGFKKRDNGQSLRPLKRGGNKRHQQ